MTDHPQSTSLSNPEGHNSGSSSLCSVNFNVGLLGHGRVGDEGSLSPLSPPWAYANLGVIYPYLVGKLCWVDLLSAVYYSFVRVMTKFISSLIFPIHSTLVAVVPSPGEREAVSESMNRDLNRVSVWYSMWGMKLNASKPKSMIVSSSSSINPIDSRFNCAEGVC